MTQKQWENKNNTGTAFSNNKTKDTQPDFKGELNVEGKIYQMAVWKKVASNNKPFLSISIDDKSKRMTDDQLANIAKPAEPQPDELNDTIPW